MSDPVLDECFEIGALASRRAGLLRVEHEQHMQRCRAQVALARVLLTRPIDPYDSMAPHDPFDLRGVKARERA